MNESELQLLFEKYQNGQCNRQEEILVEEFLNSFQTENQWVESKHGVFEETEKNILKRIEENIHVNHRRPKQRKLVTASVLLVAASIAVVLLVGIMAYNSETPVVKEPQIAQVLRKAESGQKYSIVLSGDTCGV